MDTKMKKIWDNYQIINEVQKSDKIKLVLAAATRDGVRYINIREFYYTKREDVWKPGRDGITIPIAIPIEKGTKLITPFNDFTKALLSALEVATTMDLADDDNAVYMPIKEKKSDVPS